MRLNGLFLELLVLYMFSLNWLMKGKFILNCNVVFDLFIIMYLLRLFVLVFFFMFNFVIEYLKLRFDDLFFGKLKLIL